MRIETTDPDFQGMKNLLKIGAAFQDFVGASTPAAAAEKVIIFDSDVDDPGSLPAAFVTLFRAPGHVVEISDLDGNPQTTPKMTLFFIRRARGSESDYLENALVGMDNDVRAIMGQALASSGLGGDGWKMRDWSPDPQWPKAMTEAERVTGFDAVGQAINVTAGVRA